MSALDKLYIGAKIRAGRVKDSAVDFWKSEKGVSNVVATIIILLIVVLIIGVFWDRLSEWLKGMMDTIFNTNFDDSGL